MSWFRWRVNVAISGVLLLIAGTVTWSASPHGVFSQEAAEAAIVLFLMFFLLQVVAPIAFIEARRLGLLTPEMEETARSHPLSKHFFVETEE